MECFAPPAAAHVQLKSAHSPLRHCGLPHGPQGTAGGAAISGRWRLDSAAPARLRCGGTSDPVSSLSARPPHATPARLADTVPRCCGPGCGGGSRSSSVATEPAQKAAPRGRGQRQRRGRGLGASTAGSIGWCRGSAAPVPRRRLRAGNGAARRPASRAELASFREAKSRSDGRLGDSANENAVELQSAGRTRFSSIAPGYGILPSPQMRL